MTPRQGAANGQVVLYDTPDGQVRVEVRLEQETVWLSQAQMAELFGREGSVITKHVNNVFAEGELGKESNVQNLHLASSSKPIAFYSLDVIVSVAHRVKSKRGPSSASGRPTPCAITGVVARNATAAVSRIRSRQARPRARLQSALGLE